MTFTLAQLADREMIRDVALRYCRGVDRLDVDEMKSAYWPDAIDDHGNFVGNAHEFAEHCMTAHLKWSWTMHSIFNHTIELDSETEARGEIYNITSLCRADTGDIDTWYGRYLDKYEKRGEQWRIIHRVCSHNGTSTASLAPMQIVAATFRQGDFDRPADGRPIGP